jgi:hypothetical protein
MDNNDRDPSTIEASHPLGTKRASGEERISAREANGGEDDVCRQIARG